MASAGDKEDRMLKMRTGSETRSFHRRGFAATLLMLVLAGSGVPQAAFAGSAFPIVETTLPNGLRVIIQEDRRFPIAALQVWYRVGSRNEIPGLTGISHLLEHMMFKGTSRFGPKAFSRIILENGGRENAMTSRDFTMYFTLLSPDRLPLALELEADRMRNLLLDPQELQREDLLAITGPTMRPTMHSWSSSGTYRLRAHFPAFVNCSARCRQAHRRPGCGRWNRPSGGSAE
jgi:hypothetical protein